jgi:hypothetical protein
MSSRRFEFEEKYELPLGRRILPWLQPAANKPLGRLPPPIPTEIFHLRNASSSNANGLRPSRGQ